MKSLKKLLKRSPMEVATVLVMIVVLGYLGLPAAARATANIVEPSELTKLEIEAMQNATAAFGRLPEAALRGPSYTITVAATAYNSLPEQTDSTPFITASGTHVRMGVIAANFLPMGTRVRIPEYFGDQVFVVEDRMNPRYTKRIDIWMEHIEDARQFGVRDITVEVYTE
ncbi:MAG: hypothetical protein NUV56_04815 [Candidatus Uhrbacteria bacterium]|nr:hypothetical protein [Candidatus Uhrbacteria bacterium]